MKSFRELATTARQAVSRAAFSAIGAIHRNPEAAIQSAAMAVGIARAASRNPQLTAVMVAAGVAKLAKNETVTKYANAVGQACAGELFSREEDVQEAQEIKRSFRRRQQR